MYGKNDLKSKLTITDDTVSCPVLSCKTIVNRQKKSFKPTKEFLCNKHKIYISPSTFEYCDENDNFLWKSKEDLILWNNIKNVKRESRVLRDNSEDAITWNVFRFLEKNNLIPFVLGSQLNTEISKHELIYWSYDKQKEQSWDFLVKARKEFGEDIEKGSEPDLILVSDNTLFFIEAKFKSPNKTKPSTNNPKKYLSGGSNLYYKVFKLDYPEIAVKRQKYELLRFWLLGSWIAQEMNLKFSLVNLVLSNEENNIEKEFNDCIILSENSKFTRLTWESIYHNIMKSKFEGPDKLIISDYFNNKVKGYNSNGVLQGGFSLI